MSNSIESPEIIFMNRIHELTTKADNLIEIYSQTAATIQAIPDELEFPNKAEALELSQLTAVTLAELNVAVKSLTEYSAEMNDAIDSAVRKLNSKD